MLNTIAKWISALRGLFLCGYRNPEPSDPMPDPNIIGRNSQDARLINSSDVALETPKALTSEKSSHSVSNGSAGDQSGMAAVSRDTAAQDIPPNGTDQLPVPPDNELQPDTPSSEADVQNRFTHQGTLARHSQLVRGLREVDGVSTVPSSVVEGSEETVDSQNLPVPQEVAAQFDLKDDQNPVVGRETPGSQLETLPTQGDVGHGTSQGQVTDDNASLPLSMVNDPNHSVLPASEPQGVMAQLRSGWGATLLDADKVDDAQPSPFASDKLPRKMGDDQPSRIFKERQPRKPTVMAGEIVKDAQPSRVTNDRIPEVEDDRPSQITKEKAPRKRLVVEEITENAQLSHIRT